MPSANLSENALIEYMMMRADVAVPLIVRDMGVSPSTAVGMVARLVDKGFAARSDEAVPVGTDGQAGVTPGSFAATSVGKRGRPVVTYRLRTPGRTFALAMDGSLLAGTIFDQDLQVVAFANDRLDRVAKIEDVLPLVERLARRVALEALGTAATETAAATAAQLLERARVLGVALVANAVDVGGKAVTSSVMPWVNETLPARLAEQLGLPVVVSSNIVAAAEFRVMGEPRPDPMLLLRVADGLSAHTVVAGTSFAGANRLSGELGHITFEPDGPLCGCGRRGCLETLCSGPAILRHITQGLRDGAASELSLDVLQSLPARQAIELVHNAYVAGDSFTRDAMDRVLERLAWGVGLAINLFDPQAVALGGYVLQNKPAWHAQIAERSKRWTMHAAKRELQFVGATATLSDELRLAALQFYFGSDNKRATPAAAAATT